MKRRSFFKSFMGVVATVALAPEIAFGRRLEMPQVIANPLWEPVPGEVWWLWSVKEGEEKWLTIGEYCHRWLNASDEIRPYIRPMQPYSQFQKLRCKAGLTVG